MLKNRAFACTAPRWVLEGPFSYAGCAPCQKQSTEWDQQLAQCLARLEDRTQGATLPEETRKGGRKKKKGNPQFKNLREELFRMTGTDLTQIDGIDVMAAMTVVSEVRWDMSKWKTENHFLAEAVSGQQNQWGQSH